MTKEKGVITIKKSDLWKIAAIVFAALFLVMLFKGYGSSGTAGSNTGDSGTVVPPSNQQKINVAGLIEDNDPVLGDKDAPVSVVEFSDFQCPFCARAFQGAVAELKNSDLFKNGEVNFIYKHFPLNSIHPFAQKAAEASECANRQGKFWEYHDMLFANQNALEVDNLKSYASQLGLDTSKFNKCLDGSEARSEVSKELSQATSAGGRGTPYFVIINNKDGSSTSVSGAVPFSQIEAAINSVK